MAPKAQRNGGLVASHSPNPSDIHSHPDFPKPRYPYMWFYETTVTNTLDVPLRVIWFEGYYLQGQEWVAGNIMGRELTSQDFSDWFGDGVKVVDGVIPPGKSAKDARNWHGSPSPTSGPSKWAYKAVDPNGVEYYAEAIIESVPIVPK
jgi:hypothetical protein